MKRIFVAGSLNMDLVFSVRHIPKKGETVKGERFFMNPGGKGANQAVCCGKLGADVSLIGSVGDDAFATSLIGSIEKAGVNADGIQHVENRNSGVAGIFIEDGENRIVIDRGANADTHAEQIENMLDNEASANDIFLTQCEMPGKAIYAGLKKASEKGMVTILNPAPAKEVDEAWFPYVDYVIPNEIEAETLSGFDRTESDFFEKTIQYFLEKGVSAVIVTIGEDGAVFGDKARYREFSAWESDVVDTTAAGDTFVGAFAAELAKGMDIDQAIFKASAASAIVISRFGAQQAIPTKDELDRFLERRGSDG